MRIDPEGYLYTRVKVSDCEEIIDKTIVAGELVERLAYKKDGKVYAKKNEIPVLSEAESALCWSTAARSIPIPSAST